MKYCDYCKYLSLTEYRQRELERQDNLHLLKHPLNHMCMLLNKRILHKGHHPRLPRLEDCPFGEVEYEKINS